jgi:hypothetical protein
MKFLLNILGVGLLIILNAANNAASAQRCNNWYFQTFNGARFSNGAPQFLPGGQLQGWFSCATISDNNGNLLFSSEGRNVFDRTNNLMPNGTGLLGDLCQINGLLIIPFINDLSKYYVFTAQGLSNFLLNSQDTLKYSYSIVDMALNGGLGDVVSKNNFIRFFSTEKMTAIPHANGTDIWWICRDWTNNFYSYKITCAGFQATNPVVSSIGNNINNDWRLLDAGDIKASSDGKFIAVGYRSYFEIYRFDKSTGVLSNAIKIPTVDGCYGVEFSPDSKVLYISQSFQTIPFPTAAVTQYSIANYDSTAIVNSMYNVTQPSLPFGTSLPTGLQLAPNGKIYSAWSGGPIIDVINNPNVLGAGCNFQHNVLPMPNPLSRRLPYAPAFLITSPNVQIPNATVAADCRTVAPHK